MAKVKSFGGIAVLDSDLELSKALIFQYSYLRFLQKKTSRVLRDQLVTLLSFYLIYGYSKETKELFDEFAQVGAKNINSFNYALKKLGYLTDDKMSKRVKYLHPDLLQLKKYIASSENGQFHVHIVYTLN